MLKKFAISFASFTIFSILISTTVLHATADNAAIVFANQIVDEITNLKTATQTSTLSRKHRRHLKNRLNAASFFLEKGIRKLENNKPEKA